MYGRLALGRDCVEKLPLKVYCFLKYPKTKRLEFEHAICVENTLDIKTASPEKHS